MTTAAAPDIAAFIELNFRLGPAPGLPEIQLYTAHPKSGVGRLGRGDRDPAPYWAYLWAGGAALARHLLDKPGLVAGRRVLDLGTGGGVAAIAAAKAGASSVLAIDIDPNALAAVRLNAEANGVQVETALADLSTAPAMGTDLVLAGDVFYAEGLAEQAAAFLRLCRGAGMDVLIGDPGRKSLPRASLQTLAVYEVSDFGVSGLVRGEVFAFEPWRGPLLAGYGEA